MHRTHRGNTELGRVVTLTGFGTATALQLAIAVGGAINTVIAPGLNTIRFATKAAASAQRDVVRARDALVSPRHGESFDLRGAV